MDSTRNIGYGQYHLRIRWHQPWDWAQWFVFDRRTRTIRQAYRRQYAISTPYRSRRWVTGLAVLRTYRNEVWQRPIYNKAKNIITDGSLALTLHNWRNVENYHVVWWWNKNHAAQRWNIDTRRVHFPRYPLRDGRRFQIKTRMPGNRALYYAEHRGRWQGYQLRIRNNAPWDIKQWFVFDWRTKTIRTAGNRRLAISNAYGAPAYRQNNAYARPWRNDAAQKIRWFQTTYKNIRLMMDMCLDVHGASNSNGRWTIFYKCHNGINQRWYYDVRGVDYPRYPIRDGVKFQIKSRMSNRRALFWHEHIGGNQYRVRIRNNNPENNRQWWIFDTRTRTVRPVARRNFVLANQKGYAFRINVAVVVRQYRGHYTERTLWFGGYYRNIRNLGKKCLTVYANSDVHHRHTIFYHCQNRKSQAWYIDQIGWRWPRQPIGDKVRFRIRSKMRYGRALYHETNNYLYTIPDQPWNDRTWWVFDRRSRTIRAWKRRNYVISHNGGFYFRRHTRVLPWRGQSYQRSAYYGGRFRNVRDISGLCLEVRGRRNGSRNIVQYNHCHNGNHGAWTLDQRGVHFPRYPLGNGVRFQIKTKMTSRRALSYFEHMGYGQYRLRIQDNNPYDNKQWWIFDWRTRTVRAFANRNFVISIQYNGRNWNQNNYAGVARTYRKEAIQKIRWFNGNYRNLRDLGVRCLDVQASADRNRAQTIWYRCHNGRNQAWVLDRKGW
jgi:hypothetical protein